MLLLCATLFAAAMIIAATPACYARILPAKSAATPLLPRHYALLRYFARYIAAAVILARHAPYTRRYFRLIALRAI